MKKNEPRLTAPRVSRALAISIVAWVVAGVGAALIVYGISLTYAPAAWVVAGAMLWAGARRLVLTAEKED